MNGEQRHHRRKGRGAASNRLVRYQRYHREAIEDGWETEEAPPPVATTVAEEICRSIISRNTSPDIGFDRSINPYRGCEHGCVYCYARPTHAYLGLSCGLDFETRLTAKVNAAARLRETLARPGYRPAAIMLGANTDPYQPVERRQRLTRAVLEVLRDCRHPVAITTKSAGIVRDLDLLTQLAADNLVRVGISLTTLDPWLARVMEPRASSPRARLGAIATLSAAGVPVSVLAAPMIPCLNDHELERIVANAAGAGASAAYYTLLRLPLELKDLFDEWLATHVPARRSRILARLRDCRDGQLYVADFATRMRGTGGYAELLAQRFALVVRRHGLDRKARARPPLTCALFRPPAAPGQQLSLL